MSHKQHLEEKIENTNNDVLTGRYLVPLERRGSTNNEKANRDSLSNKLRRGTAYAIMPLFIGFSSLFLGGCATTSGAVSDYYPGKDNRTYAVLDKRGSQMIIRQNNDLYLTTLDMAEKKQLTFTPNERETGALFTTDGQFIVYLEGNNPNYQEYYIMRLDGSNKRSISKEEVNFFTGY